MNESIFIDTSAWLALANKRDFWHKEAKNIRQELINNNCSFLVSDYVICEIANSLSRVQFRKLAVNLIESILSSKEIKLIRINQELFDESWLLYKHRIDKEWGLIDCTSFTIMSKYRISAAFTNDHHFEQAGFRILLK
ncbi:PIN domain-containing protein [candidate division KSB1 bacterium]|nr:PIN domain-containing protein [candidate division KSB1 bacterium]MBL7093812.1 PIN domain-containing protein [candidate division KSB1 bacterium]